MEKSLLEKWKNNTMDEIDKDMFGARLRVAADKIVEGLRIINDATTEYKDELKIMGTCIALYADSMYKKSPIGSGKIIVGETEKLKSYATNLLEELKK